MTTKLTGTCKWNLREVYLLKGGVWSMPGEGLCGVAIPGKRTYCDVHAEMHKMKWFQIKKPAEFAEYCRLLEVKREIEAAQVPDADEMLALNFAPEVEVELDGVDEEIEGVTMSKDDTDEDISYQEHQRRDRRAYAVAEATRAVASMGMTNQVELMLRRLVPAAAAIARAKGWHLLPGMTYDRLLDLCKEEHQRRRAGGQP